MPFLGTLVNFVVVLITGTLGSLIKKGIPERISKTVIVAVSVVVVYIGVSGFLEPAPSVSEGSFLSAELRKIIIMILSMAIGTLIGELIDIDKWLNRFGIFVEKKLSRFSKDGEQGHIAKGLVSCSLLFCVGAMTVNGAIQDAFGNPDIILAKTVIDAIVCFSMATTLGIGCAFSAFVILVYQGAITLIALFAAQFIPAATLSYMSMTGSLIITLVGLNEIGATKIRTANMVPAMFVPIVLAPLFELIFG